MRARNPLRAASRGEIVALVKSGRSDRDIAKKYGATCSQVEAFRSRQRIVRDTDIARAQGLVLTKIASERVAGIRAIAVDKGREAELFAGLCFEDDARALVPERPFQGRPLDTFSRTGNAAAMCAL